MKRNFLVLASFIFSTYFAHAATTDLQLVADPATTNALTTTAPVATMTLVPSLTVAPLGPFKITAGFKSFDATGRPVEGTYQNGRDFRMRNEYWAGLIHRSGWGFFGQGVQYGETYGDDNKSNYGPGDPSVTIVHPKIYDDGSLKIFGQIRRYFPDTPFTLSRHQEQYAYYFFTTYKMPRGVEAFNQLTPRYFAQDYYKVGDSISYVEDWTTLTKKVNYWFRYGAGQHTQVEWHEQTSTGRVVELYPLADFIINNNMYIEPRVFIPIYKTNEVWDSPRAVSLDSTMFEVYWQATI